MFYSSLILYECVLGVFLHWAGPEAQKPSPMFGELESTGFRLLGFKVGPEVCWTQTVGWGLGLESEV